jgi:steroid 5-alpha reductase family enzyme
MFLQVYMIGAIIVLGMMAIQWLMSLRLRDSSIVDIFWGFGFVVLAWAYFFLTSDGVPARKMLISILTTIWGLRLTMHILIRNWGKGEDFRYAKWREEAGPKWWWLSFFKVFLLQGVIMWIVSTPLLAAQIAQLPNQITVIDGIGFIVWGIGFFFEAVGDWQLRRFKSSPDNKGKLLTSGVWRYTRHPNYFGDAAQWWGFYLIAFAAGGWWTIFSPIIMTTLLVRVSGVVMLERTLMDSKPGYREYTESTSPFIPWLPRKVSNEEPAMIDFE